jgi:hypothetical protein
MKSRISGKPFRWRRLCIVLSLLWAFCSSPGFTQPVSQPSATVLARWIAAVRGGDYDKYLGCLDSVLQKLEREGSRDAMRQWKARIAEWESSGFRDSFKYVIVPDRGPGAPAGVLAFPLLNGGRLGSPVTLREETGAWRISQLPAAGH